LRVIGGIISPVADAYNKPGLAAAEHRLAMAALACQDSDLLTLNDWEAKQPQWTPTLQVLQKIRADLEESVAGKACKMMLLIGADVFETFRDAHIWDPEKLEVLLREFGVVVVEREFCDYERLLSQTPVLSRNRERIIFLPQAIRNEVSSSKVRALLQSGLSARYLIPDSVLCYIKSNHLYRR
jgi:nicotinamide mononucleotide adenylyltransferase